MQNNYIAYNSATKEATEFKLLIEAYKFVLANPSYQLCKRIEVKVVEHE